MSESLQLTRQTLLRAKQRWLVLQPAERLHSLSLRAPQISPITEQSPSLLQRVELRQ